MSNDAHDYQFHTSDISADGAKPAPPPNLNGFCLGELPNGAAEPPSKVADCTSSHFIARECSTSPSLAGAFPPDHPGWKRLYHAATWQPDPVLVDRWSWAASKVRDHEHYLKWCSLSVLSFYYPQMFSEAMALDEVQIEATWKQVRELLGATK